MSEERHGPWRNRGPNIRPGGGIRKIPGVVVSYSIGRHEVLLVNPGGNIDMANMESNGSEHATSDEFVNVQASWRESHALARKRLSRSIERSEYTYDVPVGRDQCPVVT